MRAHKEREILTRTDSQESVQIDIFKEADANIVALAKRVKASLGEFDLEAARRRAAGEEPAEKPKGDRRRGRGRASGRTDLRQG